MQIHNWNELPGHDKGDGRVQRVIAGENMTVLQQTIKAGTKPNPHSHPWEQMSIVLKGRATFRCMGKEVTHGPGGLVVFPPNEEHSTEVVGDEDFFVEEIFAPGVERLNKLAPDAE